MPEFNTYIAATKFTIGLDAQHSLNIAKGTIVEYDGVTALIEGTEHRLPSLANAVRVKWLITPDELGIKTPRVSANISMSHPTDDTKPATVASRATSDEELEVGSVADRQKRRHQLVTESSEGEVVSSTRFSTSAKTENTRIDQMSNTTEDSLVNTSSKVAGLQEAERKKLEREIESLRTQLTAQDSTVREGIRFNTEGVSKNASDTTKQTEDALPEGLWDGNEASVVGSTSGKVVQSEVSEQGSRLALAKLMVPDFEWDFEAHWRTKIKTLEDRGNTLYTAAAYAVESDSMKKNIAKHFPELGK